VSIPGENPWVTELLAAQAENKAGPSGTYQNPLKRGLDPSTQVSPLNQPYPPYISFIFFNLLVIFD